MKLFLHRLLLLMVVGLLLCSGRLASAAAPQAQQTANWPLAGAPQVQHAANWPLAGAPQVQHAANWPLAGAPQAQITASWPVIFADGQFVNGPNARGFDVAGYLAARRSPLLPYADLIQDQAAFFSLNPRLLLAILEWRRGLVTGLPSRQEIEDPLGYPDLEGFNPELQHLAEALYHAFYARLYAPQDALRITTPLKLADGIRLELPGAVNAASTALHVALAPLLSADEWQRLADPAHPQSLTQTYRRLFSEEAPLGASDPLDDSNSLLPQALPPADLLKLPFSSGDRWNFSGGPHEYDGECDGSAVVSSVDFAPGVPHCTIPPDRWVVATAAGTVSQVACGACQVEIDHGGGWITRYYHLTDTLVTQGQMVTQDQRLGHPSCKPYEGGTCGGCTGYASGTHVHMAIKYNGAYIPIDGVALEGWVVHDEQRYQCYTDGYLQRGSEIVRVGQWISSTLGGPDLLAPITTISLAGTAGDNGWYRSSVQVTLTASDSGSSGLAFTRYRLDGGAWQDYSAPFTVSGEGWHSLVFYSQDGAGNAEPENWLALPIDTQAPNGAVLLSGGAGRSPGALVALLALSNEPSGGYTAVRFRDEGSSTWSIRTGRWWEGWWLLPGPSGLPQRVEVQFRDDAGNISSSLFPAVVLEINPGLPLSAHFRLPRSAFAAAGSAAASSNFRLQGSLGPAAPPGQLSSANFRLGAGFWQPVGAPIFYLYLPRISR